MLKINLSNHSSKMSFINRLFGWFKNDQSTSSRYKTSENLVRISKIDDYFHPKTISRYIQTNQTSIHQKISTLTQTNVSVPVDYDPKYDQDFSQISSRVRLSFIEPNISKNSLCISPPLIDFFISPENSFSLQEAPIKTISSYPSECKQIKNESLLKMENNLFKREGYPLENESVFSNEPQNLRTNDKKDEFLVPQNIVKEEEAQIKPISSNQSSIKENLEEVNSQMTNNTVDNSSNDTKSNDSGFSFSNFQGNQKRDDSGDESIFNLKASPPKQPSLKEKNDEEEKHLDSNFHSNQRRFRTSIQTNFDYDLRKQGTGLKIRKHNKFNNSGKKPRYTHRTD